MKRIFVNIMLLDAALNATGNGANDVETFESDKLTELNAKIDDLGEEMGGEKFRSPRWMELNAEIFKVEALIKAEIGNIKKERANAEIEAQKNARVASFDACVALAVENGIDSDDYLAARETLVNELTARFAGSASAKVATSTTNGGGDAQKDQIIELYKSGMTHKAIEDQLGAARSTVWHVINKYKLANEPAK